VVKLAGRRRTGVHVFFSHFIAYHYIQDLFEIPQHKGNKALKRPPYHQ